MMVEYERPKYTKLPSSSHNTRPTKDVVHLPQDASPSLFDVRSLVAGLVTDKADDSDLDPDWVPDGTILNGCNKVAFLGILAFSSKKSEQGLWGRHWSRLGFLGEYPYGA